MGIPGILLGCEQPAKRAFEQRRHNRVKASHALSFSSNQELKHEQTDEKKVNLNLCDRIKIQIASH